MGVFKTDISNSQWNVLNEGVTRIVVQANGSRLWLHIGDEQPSESAPGFEVRPGDTFKLDDVADFGGTVWAKSTNGRGSVIYSVELGGLIATYADADYVDAGYFTP